MTGRKKTAIRITVLAGAMILMACYVFVRMEVEQMMFFDGSKSAIGGT